MISSDTEFGGKMKFANLILIGMLLVSFNLPAQPLDQITAQEAGLDPKHLTLVDEVIEMAIAEEQTPGAVLFIARHNKIVYKKAYGYKQLIPEKKKMTLNTIFDLASITKPVATATAAMILIDSGKLRLLDRVTDFFDYFSSRRDEGENYVKPIRIIHLLTHTSGLQPVAPWDELREKYDTPAPDSLLHFISTMDRHHPTGEEFEYSCLNFIVLQKIIEKISGQTLADFTKKKIFEPLNMTQSGFIPDADLMPYCAPTELFEGEVLRGVVHDETARILMGGNSGNAGLFSTAADLSIFSAMMLNQGQWNGKRILSKAAVRMMTSLPQGYELFGRGLGWDLNSGYSSNQGDLFSQNAYGHTGFTGTSLVIDPDTECVIILLTNRVHPDRKSSVIRLRSLVANIVAASIIN